MDFQECKKPEEPKILGYDFKFHIPNITEDQADIIYAINILLAQLLGQHDIGGGYFPFYDEGEAEDEPEST